MELVRRVVRAALEEDGAFQDVTTLSTVPPDQRGRGVLLSKDSGVLAGMPVLRTAFELVDPAIELQAALRDGSPLEHGSIIARVEGPLASILSAERIGLNFLQRLSGTATLT